MTTTIVLLIIGLIVLIVGGDFLVRGASSIALRLNISPLVVGLTIVAFGTSSPELFISIQSAVKGSPDIAMGNVIGSNICNLALVLGLTAVINPVRVQPNSIRIDWPMAMGSSILLYLLVREGYLVALEGGFFLLILAVYLFAIIRQSRREIKAAKLELKDSSEIPNPPAKQIWKDLIFMVIGCVGLYYGSEWFVGSAKTLALSLGVEERVVGLTVVALGTSLPELVTAAVASYKGQSDLALGNLMGSNIFNILSILGITSIIKEIHVNADILDKDIIWMLMITLMVLPLMIIHKKVGRIDGLILLFIYGIYVYTVIA